MREGAGIRGVRGEGGGREKGDDGVRGGAGVRHKWWAVITQQWVACGYHTTVGGMR